MKVSLRRHGIVIRVLEVTGDKAKVGSGEQCEVRIDDPYLSAHVADLVNQGGTWKIVDTGTSLEGVTREGSRVEDEAVIPGVSYAVGGFELIFEGVPGSQAPSARTVGSDVTAPAPGPFRVPETVVESFDNMRGAPAPGASRPAQNAPIPKTLFEAPMPGEQSARPPAVTVTSTPQPISNPAVQGGFQPMSGMGAAPAAPPPKKSSKKILFLALGMGLLFLLLIVVLLGGRGEKKVTPVATTTIAPIATPTPLAVVPADPVQQGDAYALNLEVDKALESWEKALSKGANPDVQSKYVRAALEVGLVHAAANDMTGARKYFEKVVQHGPPDSPEVQLAKSKLSA